jgi:hypothetical protein
MSNPIPDLMSKAIDVRNVVQRMMASFNLFAMPPTRDLEQTLSFEFFYQRRAAFGRRDPVEIGFKTEMDGGNGRRH